MLNVLRFLATTVPFDLDAALQEWNGFDHIQRQSVRPGVVALVIEGLVTANSSENAPDRYLLQLERQEKSISRYEEFTFKRRGRSWPAHHGQWLSSNQRGRGAGDLLPQAGEQPDNRLATLPKLSDEEGGLGMSMHPPLQCG